MYSLYILFPDMEMLLVCISKCGNVLLYNNFHLVPLLPLTIILHASSRSSVKLHDIYIYIYIYTHTYNFNFIGRKKRRSMYKNDWLLFLFTEEGEKNSSAGNALSSVV